MKLHVLHVLVHFDTFCGAIIIYQ